MLTTVLIIAATCVVSFFAFNDHKLIDRLILWPPAVDRGKQYYRLLTYGFIHADLSHLLFNMFTLFFFGAAMERFYNMELGAFGFALFYAGGLIVSILPTYIVNRHNPQYRSLGASGAVSAVLFAFILMQPWALILVFVIPVPAIIFGVAYLAYEIYMGRRGGGNVNHSAHLWGAAYGVLFTIIMEPRVLPAFFARLLQPHFGG